MVPTQKAPSGPTFPSLRRLVSGSPASAQSDVSSPSAGSNRWTVRAAATTRRPLTQRPNEPTLPGKVQRSVIEPLGSDAITAPSGISHQSRRPLSASQTGLSPSRLRCDPKKLGAPITTEAVIFCSRDFRGPSPYGVAEKLPAPIATG